MDINKKPTLTDQESSMKSENTTLKPVHDKAIRVLSLDGGGMRGIYTAAFLDRLTNHYSKGKIELDFGRGFELITGCSTGAIIACALAIGLPMTKVVELYRQHGSKIFPHRIRGQVSALYRITQGRRYVRAGDRALRKALKEVLGELTMLDVYQTRGISLSIPAIHMSEHRPWVFKKSPCSGRRDDNYKLVDVCMATSAAPIFRSLAVLDDPISPSGPQQVFADGGLWANNPIIVGLVDALKIAKPNQSIEIFSLGTCPRPEGKYITKKSAHRTMLDWRFGAEVATLSIYAQEQAFDDIARLLANAISSDSRSIRCVRFPSSPVSAEMMPYLGIDDTRKEALNRLIRKAYSDADLTKSQCDDSTDQDGQMILQLMHDLPEMPTTGVFEKSRSSLTNSNKEEQ